MSKRKKLYCQKKNREVVTIQINEKQAAKRRKLSYFTFMQATPQNKIKKSKYDSETWQIKNFRKIINWVPFIFSFLSPFIWLV